MFSQPSVIYGVSIEKWVSTKVTVWFNRVSFTFMWAKGLRCIKRTGSQVDFHAEQPMNFFIGLVTSRRSKQ